MHTGSTPTHPGSSHAQAERGIERGWEETVRERDGSMGQGDAAEKRKSPYTHEH